MISAGSRYEKAERLFTVAHTYSQWGFPVLEGDNPNLKIKVMSRETSYLLDANPTAQPPTQEYYAKDTENIQFLGYKFLGDPGRWWEIANANPKVWYPLDLEMGDYIVIPA